MERNKIKQQQTQAHRSFVVNVWSLHLKRVEWPGHMARIHIGTGWMHHVFCAVCWTCFHVSRGFLLAKPYDKTHHATYMHWSACVRLWAIQIHIDKWPSEPLCIYLFARQPQKPKTAHNEARFFFSAICWANACAHFDAFANVDVVVGRANAWCPMMMINLLQMRSGRRRDFQQIKISTISAANSHNYICINRRTKKNTTTISINKQ